MVAKIVDLADPDDAGTQFASVAEAERALSEMLDKFKLQRYTITQQQFSSDDRPQFKVVDYNDEWVGTYTVIATD